MLEILLKSTPSLAQPSKNPSSKQKKMLMKIPKVEHDEKGIEMLEISELPANE